MSDSTDKKLLKIGELAAMAGISVKAMHVYEEKNVIKPVHVDTASGYRYYSPDQLKQVESLLALQDMGFSLSEIAKILSGECTDDDLAEIFAEKEKALQEILWKTEAKMNALDGMKQSLKSGADKLKQMSEEERASYLARLVILNEENIRQVLSEVLWL